MDSLRSRIALAIGLTVAFYLLALTVALGLIVGPIAVWASSGTGNLWLTLASVGAGVAVLQSIVPPRDQWVAPGLEVTREQQPRLFALLDEVAAATDDRRPDAVYVDLEVNAGVSERRRRRELTLGLPLLAVLTEAELRAVLAHEHGHYVGGDTRFGEWIWRTRVTVLRTWRELASDEGWFMSKVVSLPFRLYAQLFLRITNAVSRRQEFAADALAARVTSPAVTAAALRRINTVAPFWDGFWHQDLVPMLEAERRPPVADGFRSMLAGREVVAALEEIVTADTFAGEPNPYDSHPTLGQRLGALGVALDGTVPPPPTQTATALFDDLPGLEREIFLHRFGPEVGAFAAADWDGAASVHGDRLTATATRWGAIVGEAFTVGDAAELAADLPSFRHRLRELLEPADRDAVEGRQLDGLAFETLVALVAEAAVRAGATITAPPGETLRVHLEGAELDVGSALGAAVRGDKSPAEWRALPVVAHLAAAPLRPRNVAATPPA